MTDSMYAKLIEINTFQNLTKKCSLSNTIRLVMNKGMSIVLEDKPLQTRINTFYKRKKINDSFALFDSIEKEKEK